VDPMSARPHERRTAAAEVLAGYRRWVRGEITEAQDAEEEWSSWAGRLAAELRSLLEQLSDSGAADRRKSRPEDPAVSGGPVHQADEPRVVTYVEAEVAYQGTTGPRKRFEDLTMRDLLSRARAMLRARGEFDPALHGTEEQAPLTVEEHLEILAAGELLARYYRHPSRVHAAVLATATWAQVAAATGTSEPAARQAYREWADRQHALWQHREGRFGLSDAEHADAVRRAAEPDPEAAR
jgi:hypothetical protein